MLNGLAAWRFLWRVSKGYRLRPWRSPLLAWRIETYCGLAAEQVGFAAFWRFCWLQRGELLRFLRWTSEMDGHRRHGRHLNQS